MVCRSNVSQAVNTKNGDWNVICHSSGAPLWKCTVPPLPPRLKAKSVKSNSQHVLSSHVCKELLGAKGVMFMLQDRAGLRTLRALGLCLFKGEMITQYVQAI